MKLLSIFFLSVLGSVTFAENEKLVVHEWGTFTSLQDESGRTLGGINSDDESLPKFTHDIDHLLVLKQNALPPSFYQGAPQALPRVTMRLETPVIYFYPARNSSIPLVLDLTVAFRGGWLTRYYPEAQVDAPGAFSELTPSTLGKASWRGLRIGVTNTGPATTEHVWTAPRAVNAAAVLTAHGECEKFLFYRGVGNLNAPLRLVRDETSRRLSMFSQLDSRAGLGSPLSIQHLWLASFQTNSSAFRRLEAISLKKESTNELLSTAATFRENEYGPDNLNKLRAEMRGALVSEGLFADEADALLSTWELSYFKSAGLRLFFLLPRAWTDDRLPLEISVPAEIRRVMVGRIELVTPEQRTLLRQLAEAPIPKEAWARRQMEAGKPVIRGTMPAAYRDLGRFRNALVLDEIQRRETMALRMFVLLNGLDNYRVEE